MNARRSEALHVLWRVIEAHSDGFRLCCDEIVREAGREWDPEFEDYVLSDEEREALEQRALGRTLAEIDDLPSTPRER